MVFMNVYEITREYGGPEEGGWWFTAKTPRISIRINGFDQRHYKKLLDALKEEFPEEVRFNRYNREEVERHEVLVQLHRGRNYPEHSPHYE